VKVKVQVEAEEKHSCKIEKSAIRKGTLQEFRAPDGDAVNTAVKLRNQQKEKEHRRKSEPQVKVQGTQL
jgi:hypothetical protein